MSSKVICICTRISACGDTLQHVYCLFNILASSFSAGQIFKKVSLAGQFIGTEYHILKYWIDSYCLVSLAQRSYLIYTYKHICNKEREVPSYLHHGGWNSHQEEQDWN